MSQQQLSKLLQNNKELAQFASLFEQNNITGNDLLEMEPEDLQVHLGIKSFILRKKLWRWIQNYVQENATTSQNICVTKINDQHYSCDVPTTTEQMTKAIAEQQFESKSLTSKIQNRLHKSKYLSLQECLASHKTLQMIHALLDPAGQINQYYFARRNQCALYPLKNIMDLYDKLAQLPSFDTLTDIDAQSLALYLVKVKFMDFVECSLDIESFVFVSLRVSFVHFVVSLERDFAKRYMAIVKQLPFMSSSEMDKILEVLQSSVATSTLEKKQNKRVASDVYVKQPAKRVSKVFKDDDALDCCIYKAPESSSVYLPCFLADLLKPHQVEGVRFMWKNLCQGHGCVLAHAMGLMKTLQVIALIYTLCKTAKFQPLSLPQHLRQGKMRILVLTPATILDNWRLEFQQWIPEFLLSSTIGQLYQPSQVSAQVRLELIQQWIDGGGVLLLGYEMFRDMINIKSISNVSAQLQQLRKILLDQGPHLVVCDEGHRLKNRTGLLTTTLSRIKTLSRICLTGSPLQNNLEEYYCMVDFVRPSYLCYGIADFRQRFVHVIMNGLALGCSQVQMEQSRQALYVLQKLLEPFVQRLNVSQDDNSAMENIFSCKKVDYVIKVRLTDVQLDLYQTYLKAIGQFRQPLSGANGIQNVYGFAKIQQASTVDSSSVELLAHYQEFLRICNHPAVSYNVHKQQASNLVVPPAAVEIKAVSQPDLLPLGLDAGGIEVSSDVDDDDLDVELNRSLIKINQGMLTSYRQTLESYQNVIQEVQLSTKVQIAFKIIKEARLRKEKVLLFSRSIPTLDYIGNMLNKTCNYTGTGISSLRLDGRTAVSHRQQLISKFNDTQLYDYDVFLISTMVGCLGVNLQSASRVILLDAGWNPSHDEQAIARAFRFGQKQSQVVVYRLYTYGTMEDTLYKINRQKMSLFSTVIDQKALPNAYTRQELQRYFECPPNQIASKIRPQQWFKEDSILDQITSEFASELVQVCRESSVAVHDAQYNLQDEALAEAERQLKAEQQRIKQ